MRKSHLKLMLAALLLLCSTVASAATYDDWTSTNKTAGSTSSNTYTIEATAGENLSFNYEVSSESNFDWLTVTLNGEELLKISGERLGFYQYNFTADGTYTLEATYTKDSSVDYGDDCGKIYNINVGTSSNIPGGPCGYNATWSFVNSVLTISGTGAIYNNEEPWSSYKSDITSVIVEEGITSIGDYAFFDYDNLTNVTLPLTLTSIGIRSFDESGLTSIYIPANVATIGESAFGTCSSIESIVVDDYNTVFDSRNNCNAIIETSTNKLVAGCKNTIIPDDITSIESYAFAGCHYLESITIPEGVTSIGSEAFANCVNLRSITSHIPAENLFAIDSYKFYGVDKNNCTLYVPAGASATYAATYAWNEFTNIVELEAEEPELPSVNGTCGDNLTWNLYNGTLTISGTGEMYNYDSSSNAPWHEHRDNITTIFIEDGVTSIGDYAFWQLHNVSALYGYAITIPNSVTKIGNCAFAACTSLLTIEIPSSVTSIGISIFGMSENLARIVVDENNTIYDSRNNCNAIIETATNTLIAGCRSTTIPNSVTKIGDYAFIHCYNLTSITIPESVTKIGWCAFCYCTGLSEVTIPNSVTQISDMAFHSAGITSIILPENITALGSGLFYDCTNLANVTIPNSVTDIYAAAFYGCTSLTSITIPENVRNIHGNVFIDCTNLTSLISLIPAENLFAINSNVFENVDKNACTLYVPAGAKATYEATSGWNEFTNIVELEGEGTLEPVYFDSADGMPGTMTDGHHIWESSLINCDGKINGVRITVFETSGSNNFYNGYPMVTLGELEFYDAQGNKIEYTADNVTTNSLETSEGSLDALRDGAYSTFYHSKWNTGTTPNDYVYLDVNFPRSVDSFTIKIVGRNTQNPFTPKSIGVTKAGNYCPKRKITSGSCGNNATWSYANNTLTISGTGAMTNYASPTAVPWNEYDNEIQTVFIAEGITSISQDAFNGCAELANLTIPSTINQIGMGAFSGCESITSVVVPEGVTNLEYQVFGGCSSLTDVTLPSSLTTISWGAFSECSSLANISIPTSVTEIGHYAFDICTSLESITIPEGVTSIGEYTFKDCSSLTSITSFIPAENLFAINSNAFQGVDNDACTLYVPAGTKETYAATEGWNELANIVQLPYGKCGDNATWEFADGVLTISGTGAMYDYAGNDTPWNAYRFSEIKNVVVNEGITRIGDSAFRGFEVAESVLLPESLTSIGNRAFSGNALREITMPNSLTIIEDYAFYMCTNLESITIPENVTSIGNSVFSACNSLESIDVANGNTIYDSRDNCNAIIETATNTLIASCKNTIIPNSVTSIGYGAFYNCSSHKSITIPNSVTSIGQSAFGYCRNLTSVTSLIPAENLFAINSNVFENVDKNACTLYVPAGTKETYAATEGWSEFTNIVELAYGKCGDNATWELVDGVLTISGTGDMYDYNYETKPWYNYQNEVTSIVIESGITGIGESAFYGCENTASIIIPEGVTTIGEYAFNVCRKLTSLELPASVRYVGKITSTNLTSIVVKEGNTVYDSRNNCNAVIETATNTLVIGCKTTIIPDGITSIGDYAFFYRYGLTGIDIPESVTSIGEAAFQGCYDLESITIPAGVTYIGEWAFCSCEGLESFTSLIPAEYLFGFDHNAFYDICCRLYVPAGAKEAYEESSGWQYFAHSGIVELAAEDFKLTVGSAGYATLYLSHEVARPRGVKAYYISEIKNDYAVLEGLWDEIPAKTAVIIQAAPGTYTFKQSTYYAAPVANNLLCGTPIDKEIPAAANTTYYALGRSNGVVGLYRALIEDGVYFNNANKAYLPLAEAQQSARFSFRFPDGTTTDIETVLGSDSEEVIYDLSGRRIDKVKEHGVYIINGKKVVR